MKVKVVTKVLVDGREVAKEKVTGSVETRSQAQFLRDRAIGVTEGLANRLITEAGFNV